jgi:hypothetical protein
LRIVLPDGRDAKRISPEIAGLFRQAQSKKTEIALGIEFFDKNARGSDDKGPIDNGLIADGDLLHVRILGCGPKVLGLEVGQVNYGFRW